MDNKIIYVTKDEAKIIEKDAIENDNTYFVKIDGSKIKTEEQYVKAMMKGFAFPHDLPEFSISWYNDYITDLMWVEQKEISLLIRNYDLMLDSNVKIKKNIMADFEEIILPWWEGDVVGHMVGGVPRKFLIYLECMK